MSNAPDLLPLAVTCGEPAGIGHEITLKAWQAARGKLDIRPFFLISDPALAGKAMRELGAGDVITTISDPSETADVFGRKLPVLPPPDGGLPVGFDLTPGTPKVESAGLVTAAIERAVSLCLDGKAAAIVTNPIQKKTLADAGFKYPGHTEFLGALTSEIAVPDGFMRGPVMMLAGGGLRVVPASVHLPLSHVPGWLSPERIYAAGIVTVQALLRDFGIEKPRIALAGLNPHAGEGGMLGIEEMRTIAPAAEALRQQGIDIIGPFPADTMFHEEARQQYHAAIAMYHDQGLIPVKTLAFHSAVNITLGLPIVRTSPDHGTALPIAGKNVARPDSLLSALGNADAIARNRAAFDARREKSGA